MSSEIYRDTREKADFHVHYEPDRIDNVIERAARENVVALGLISKLSIPNNDEVEEYTSKASDKGISAIIGVEVSKPICGSNVDTISLGFDHDHPEIRELFGKEERRQRSIEVAMHQEKVLLEERLDITPQSQEDSDLLASLRSGDISEKAIRYCELVVANKVNSDRIEHLTHDHPKLWQDVTTKYVNGNYYNNLPKRTAKFLWFLYFEPGQKGHVPNPDSAKKIIDSVHNAGGVVLYSPEGEYIDDQYNEFLSMGGDGIMAWHGGQLGKEPRRNGDASHIPYQVIKNTYKSGKLVLGGSDFDPKKDDWQVGVGEGSMYISPRRYVNLQRYQSKK